jgi:hypothetical protein
MSIMRTQPTESAGKRAILKNPRTLGRSETRAERNPSRTMLEYTPPPGGPLKTCTLFFGGEFRAG